MKAISIKTVLAALFAGLITTPSILAAETNFDFSAPPYTAGQTAIGIQGWTAGVIDSTNNNDAGIITIDGENLLRVYSTGTTNYRTSLRTSFTKIAGSGPDKEVWVTINAGWSGFGNQGAIISLANADYNTPLLLNFTTSKGIAAGTNSLLSFDDTRNDGSLYQFNIKLNYTTQTFDILFTGTNKSDQPVNTFLQGLDFGSGVPTNADGLSNLFIANTGGNTKSLYVQSISITNVPEPKTVAMLLLGGLLLLGLQIRKFGCR